MIRTSPTIKGIFVKTHVYNARKELGEGGIEKLQQCVGRSLDIKNFDAIPVADEVAILECTVQLTAKESLSPEEIAYRAGELHFKNFLSTPLGKTMFSVFGKSSSFILLRAKYITPHIFNGMIFEAESANSDTILVIIKNSGYPPQHFCGFFDAWLAYMGTSGSTSVSEIAPHMYQYALEMKDSIESS